MILQSLYKLYDRLKDDPDYLIVQPGFSIQKISFRVVLKNNGDLFGIQDARVLSDGKPRSRQVKVLGETKKTGSGLNPCFLWDNTGYMLGFDPDKDPDRMQKAFQAFRTRHLELEQEINAAPFSVVCRFLDQWNPARAADYPELTELKTGFGIFQIEGERSYVHEYRSIQEWWERHLDTTPHDSPKGQCLITGKVTTVSRLHNKIKGVVGGKSSGASLVSFNENSYKSYGKEKSFNAPVSESAAFRYTIALNGLLDSPMRSKHTLRLGDTTVAFWTDKPTWTEDIFAQFAIGGAAPIEEEAGGEDTQDDVVLRKLVSFLEALRKGREAYGDLDTDHETTSFYLLGLSPNAARVSVRFFYHGWLGELLDNLRKHYFDIGTAPQPASGKRKADPEFPPFWLLLKQTARESKEIPPVLAGPLLRAVITGTRYPDGLFAATMRRICADKEVNYARVCIIKGYLKRNLKKEVCMSLDVERTDPPYRLGRLFAVLEKTQKDALGDLSASIRDRYYSSASATPGSVFPRLLRTYQHHLAKLEGGYKVNREKLVQEIMDPLTGFPAQFSLSDQGLFAIGYYHQTRNFYTKKNDDK